MSLRLIVTLFLFNSIVLFSQESTKKHTIVKGETISSIAEKYDVKQSEIYKLNPKSKKLLKLNSVLLIPVTVSKNTNAKSKIATNYPKKEHEVLAKETLYGIARQYGITVKELNEANPTLETSGLKIGQKIEIPGNATSTEIAVVPQQSKIQSLQEPAVIPQPINDFPKSELIVVSQSSETSSTLNGNIVREVLPKETKYGIAKQYGITVQELEKQNPEIKNKLLVGYKLNIQPAKINESIAVLNTENTTPEFINTESDNEKYNNVENNNWEFKSFVKPVSNPNFLDELIETASSKIGTRYQSGGTSKSGYDCSGLMFTTFGAFDIKLPRTSFEQSRLGVVVNPEDAQKGDLIFFKTNGRSRINHVGMVVEVCDGDIKFIHASVGGGVVISSVKEKYYEKKLTQINRVLQ